MSVGKRCAMERGDRIKWQEKCVVVAKISAA